MGFVDSFFFPSNTDGGPTANPTYNGHHYQIKTRVKDFN